jgi:hypothetical protein
MDTTDHRAAGASDEDVSHSMLLAVLMSRGGSLDVDGARYAHGAAGGTRGAVELLPLDEGRVRLRAVPPAGTPGSDQTSHAALLGVLAALGGHADVDLTHFEPDALGGPDGAFHSVGARTLPGGGIRLQVIARPQSAR